MTEIVWVQAPRLIRHSIFSEPAEGPPRLGAVPTVSSGGHEQRASVAASQVAIDSAQHVRGASGTVARFPPLRMILTTRCPRSVPRSVTSISSASLILNPFSPKKEHKGVAPR